MSESRSNPRTHVAWRGAVQVAPGQITVVKIVNFSGNGAQILCPKMLAEKQTYQIMLEMPDRRDPTLRVQVVCKAAVLYSILSGESYRIGVKLSDIPPEHAQLVQAYVNKT